MTKQEKELFKQLCSFKSKKLDTELLSCTSPEVLGQLFINRMQAIAYGKLKDNNLLNNTNREFRNSLKTAYESNVIKNDSYFTCIEYINKLFNKCNCNYALLKGAYLCQYYPKGFRTSNDIDLLVTPEDVTTLSKILYNNGFKQGQVRNDKFIPATRAEIITSKMTRGETIPYIKEVNLPGMKFLEIDINFSLDYKPSDATVLNSMLKRVIRKNVNGLTIQTLDDADFFIHLCNHLYKEATTLPWVEMHRDMTLYKYCDIYSLLSDASNEYIDEIFKRAKEIDEEKICAFAIIQTSQLFDFENEYALSIAIKILNQDMDFLHTVISPTDNKTYIYVRKNIAERLFTKNRRRLLLEVKQDEKLKNET